MRHAAAALLTATAGAGATLQFDVLHATTKPPAMLLDMATCVLHCCVTLCPPAAAVVALMPVYAATVMPLKYG